MELLERAVSVLRTDDRILAAWLGGSFGAGYADAWSDVDVHCLIDASAADELRRGSKTVLARVTPTVMATSFPPPTIGGYSLTPECLHLDLVFRPTDGFDASELAGSGRCSTGRVSSRPSRCRPRTCRALRTSRATAS